MTGAGRDGFVRVDGVPVHVRVEGSGPVAVLSAGLGLGWYDWDPVVPFLAPHRTVVRFDRPGHGLSGPAAAPPTAAGEARRIAAVLDALGLSDRGPVTVAGHSAAGFHAEAFARLHPGRTAALLLVDGSVAGAAAAPLPALRTAAARALGALATAAGLPAALGPAARRAMLRLGTVGPYDGAAERATGAGGRYGDAPPRYDGTAAASDVALASYEGTAAAPAGAGTSFGGTAAASHGTAAPYGSARTSSGGSAAPHDVAPAPLGVAPAASDVAPAPYGAPAPYRGAADARLVRRCYRTGRVWRGMLLENARYPAMAAEVLALRAARPLPAGLPVTVLAGYDGSARDPALCWLAAQAALADALGARFEVAEPAGHLVMRDRPRQVARAVVAAVEA
ncbi:alpha/beta fold hydrolase [Streptomyces sp. NPDC101132]|uniref:alpha/beta fold hydrolase n=1 Tax=Streptomyces sp. NPDC101132 TaxID=3366110 RepID=UPI0038024B59